MKENEYIKKAEALVEAKKQYYATLSDLSQFTPDEENRYEEISKMSHLLNTVIGYRDRGEDVPVSILCDLANVEKLPEEIYYSPEAFHREFLDGIGGSIDNAYNICEQTSSLFLLIPFMRTIDFIEKHKFIDWPMCEPKLELEMIKALLSLEERKY